MGFKRVDTLLIYTSSSYYYDLKLGTIDEFIKNYIDNCYSKFDPKKDTLLISNMHMSCNYSNIKKIQTFRLKISESTSLYITIQGQSYSSYMQDLSLPINKSVIFIENAQLTPDFWKRILSKLDVLYKREIIMNQIV